MYTILIDSANTTSAGTGNVTKILLSHLNRNNKDFKIIFYVPIDFVQPPEKNSLILIKKIKAFSLYYFINLIFDLYFINPDKIIVLANYNIFPTSGKKIIFMRHPYLVKLIDEIQIPFIQKAKEILRRLIFRISTLSSDFIVTQTKLMHDKTKLIYNIPTEKMRILKNPIMLNIAKPNKNGRNNDIIYISRFHPHKNHLFIFNLVDKYYNYFLQNNISITLTIGNSYIDDDLKRYLSKYPIRNIIRNIGEINIEDLYYYYHNAFIHFFPSKAETFGNPLIESICFGVPLVVPDLPYAKELCQGCALFYRHEDIDDAFNKIKQLFESNECWSQLFEGCIIESNTFINISQWWNELISF